MNIRVGLLTPALFVTACLAAPAFAQTVPVTLAWDASTEAPVTGYIVYVGNASGVYQEQFTVGPETSFVFPHAVLGRGYYFAVAAYTAGPTIGPRSEEVFFLAGMPASRRPDAAVPAAAADETPGNTEDAACGSANTCGAASRIAVTHVSSLTPTGDGRLLVIEDRQRIRIISDDTLVAEPALEAADDRTQFASFVLDPDFPRNRFAYVGQVTKGADGRRELNIVRYREVGNVLAEAAVIVPGLQLAPSGEVPIAIDASRRIYVAMPGMSGTSGTAPAYAGMILRFESDGTVAPESPTGSPLFSRGYARPGSLVWVAAGNELWLSGTDAEWAEPIARLPLDDGSVSWLRVPASTNMAVGRDVLSLGSASPTLPASATHHEGMVLVVDAVEGLTLLAIHPEGAAVAQRIPLNSVPGTPGAAAFDGTDIYVSVATAGKEAAPASVIYRLRVR